MAYLPAKALIADKPIPANKQKGRKKCTCCGDEKPLSSGFYISKSPMFQIDGRVNVCKLCTITASLNDDGSINEIELNKMLRRIDKPYYKDYLQSAYNQFRKEYSYVEESDVLYHGKEILQFFFKNSSMRQTINKNYEDSEKEGFIFQNSNTSFSEKKAIRKHGDIKSNLSIFSDKEDKIPTRWTKKDRQNMNYSISAVGHDPFEDVGLSDEDRKYCFNILAGYLDTDGIIEDGHKMQGVIEMSMLYCQCKKITETMNIELDRQDVDDTKISKLTSSKSSLLSSVAQIAKDNNIASNYNKNSKQGQNSITSKMKEMEENDFEMIKVNLFDIKTSEAFRQIAELSNQSIMDQLTFDSSEYTEIVKEQRGMIQKYEMDIDVLSEENRNLKNKIIDLERKTR